MEKEYGQAPPPGYGDHGFGSQAYPPQPQAHQGYPSQPYPSQPYPSQPYPSQPYPPSSEAYPMHPQGAHHGTHLQPGPTHGMVTSGSVSSVDPPPYSPPPKFDEMVIQDQGPTPRYNDLWATILFLVNLGGFVVLAFFSFRGNPAPDPFLTPADQEALVFTLLAASAFSVGFGALYSLGLWYNARTMIFVSQFIVIALFLAYGAFCFIYVSMVAGIIWLLFALIQGIFFYFFRHRIPFAALMLKTVIGILTRYPTCLLAAFAGMGIQIAWTVLFIYVLSNAAGIWTGGSLYGICFYLVFTYYWFSQVIKNTVHVTLSGMFATHYFMLGTASFPPHPVGSSFRRAITYCFGSICFGSLIVAAIKTLRYAVRMAFRDHGILRFCADLLLGMIDNLVQYFNHYAFTEVAIYGKSFCKAGKSIWELFKRNGIDAIVNDDLIGSVLLLAVLIAAAGSFGIGFGLAYVFPQDLNPVYMGLVALLVGAMIMVVVTDAVESGTASILVCLAEDPNALLRTNPDLYQSIQDTYQTVLPSGRV